MDGVGTSGKDEEERVKKQMNTTKVLHMHV
jgi:hypothetical protein